MSLKNTTYEDLWKGDFDKDGTPNIDDKKPFDKKVKDKVNSEMSLKQTYENLELRRDSYSKDIQKLKKKLGICEGRVKDQYSSINKQLGRNISTLEDMGGLRELVDKRKDVYKELKKIRRKFPHRCTKKIKDNCIKEIDDKYKQTVKEKFKRPYLAVHVNLRYKKKPYEIQIKTHKNQQISDSYHSCYKYGDYKCLKNQSKDFKNAYKQGY